MTDITHDADEIRDYLVGRLSERERLVFQDRVARDPALASELEHSLRLRDGLRQLKGQGYFVMQDGERRSAVTGRLARWLPLATAAIVAAVCVGAWWELKAPDSVLRASGEGSPSAQWTFISTRGDDVPRLKPPAGGLVEFRIAPEITAAAAYRVTLERLQAPGVNALGTVESRIGSDHYLHAYASAARLSPGDYLLRVAAAGSALPPLEFAFRVTAAGGPTPP
jgi:hypothetical protein